MLRGLLIAAPALLGCIACTDQGIVGSRAAPLCEPSCTAGELCHPDLGQCVECASDTDCAGSPGGPLCDVHSNACRTCDAGDTCPAPECEPPDEPDDFFEDDDCDLDEGDASTDDDAPRP